MTAKEILAMPKETFEVGNGRSKALPVSYFVKKFQGISDAGLEELYDKPNAREYPRGRRRSMMPNARQSPKLARSSWSIAGTRQKRRRRSRGTGSQRKRWLPISRESSGPRALVMK